MAKKLQIEIKCHQNRIHAYITELSTGINLR